MVEKPDSNSISISEEASSLHFGTPVIDAHCDTLGRTTFKNRDIGHRQKTGHIDLFKLEAGGVKIQVFAAFVHPSQSYRGFFNLAMKMNDSLHHAVDKYPSRLRLIVNSDEIEKTIEEKGIGAIFGIEGAHSLEGDINKLYQLYNKGLRLVTLTWNNSNPFADSSAEASANGGLSLLGIKLIKEMNKLGIVADLSHASPKTLKDVISVSSKPVLVSHSCCKAICDIHRNLTDDQIKMVAKNGGVIGVNFFPLFLDQEFLNIFTERDKKRLAEFSEINKKLGSRSTAAQRKKKQLTADMFRSLLISLPPVSYKRIVDHIEHIIDIGGEDCVGLGSDFD
jgi:membrane dipeptidase